MSLSSTHSSEPKRRVNNPQNGKRPDGVPRRKKPSINGNDAYLYALRVAYLAYLLQPRSKRSVQKPLPKPPLVRSVTGSSVQDLMKDFTVRDPKSTKYPHDFIKELDKRLKGILMGAERRPEFQNKDVIISFAAFWNQLSNPTFRQQREQDRRVEDLILIFYSHAVQEMQKGKAHGDEGVKRTVDRHVALFVKLMSMILRDKGWARDRPELASRLQTLESKLMKHDEDLVIPTTSETTTIEEEVPLTYEVKDMAMVQVVGNLFGLRQSMLQSDIDKHKSTWTEKEALHDLKTYQAHLNIGTAQTLSTHDFDTQEAFEEWKKAEAAELSQMIIALIKSHPSLAQNASGTNLQDITTQNNGTHHDDYSELSRALSQEGPTSPYVLDLPADLGSLNLDNDVKSTDQVTSIYTFIPTNPRAMFQYIMQQALTHDLNNSTINGAGADMNNGPLSKASSDFLSELALRWRIPMFSRIVLFLDVIKDKFIETTLDLEGLDAAFNYIKRPVADEPKARRTPTLHNSLALLDRYKWTIADFSLMQQVLSAIYETLLRSLYEAMMTCYDPKPSSKLGPILTVLDDHIRNDPSFTQPAEMFEQFKQAVAQGLSLKAQELYSDAVEKELPVEQEKWEFYHLIELKKNIMKHSERVQKRYRKNPQILGIEPLATLCQAMLPAYAQDSEAIVKQVMDYAASNGQDVPIQDGLDLYPELCEFRQVYAQALPGEQFPYSVEELLQDFVWKWVKSTETQVVSWVDNAVKQDKFAVRTSDATAIPTDDERHSVSVIDVFRSFNQIIEQIAQLNWDDDLTYAKFMTSLSKAIGVGITKYCDLLDQIFSKEMDRMTPEQEAAAKATRQERWVQMAKDTWNQKERVEPFNFYAESFVKLNNISFAIHQWDKLESDVNVDGCADVIKRNTPPLAQRPKKFSNYVFTIKIVEAEDLKSCDINGYSDPYVVLADEYQKRLFKSKIVYRNLNPRFDESIDITTQGALNVIATIWDWDAVGDHDYVGRTSLKLDPSHFADFLPREYWLDLDTQGRLLVRVSMEGERDDIQFYFAKAFRALQRTQRDMTRKITDKLSAYISHSLSRRALRALLSRGIPNISNISMSTFSSWRNRQSLMPAAVAPTNADVLNALQPLYRYFDDNFAIMNQTLTPDAMIAVMTRLWKEVLVTVEGLLVPPLSDKPSQQKPLTQQELDIVYKWLQSLFDFFHAVDEDTGEANGVPINILKSPKYHELQTLNFFYFETTENLIRESERMVSATTNNTQSRRSAPASYGTPNTTFSQGGLLAVGSAAPARRAKSIMASRNLGTMKKAKEEKWKAAQAEPSDDMILRILRMRPEAGVYLKDRSRQKERLATKAAADMIVKQSLAAGGGRMTGPSIVRH